jgi:hypothetical protein
VLEDRSMCGLRVRQDVASEAFDCEAEVDIGDPLTRL